MNIKTYTLILLKRKPYFIKELSNKLLKKYSKDETYSLIKELIKEDYLNDKKLVKLKLDYLINFKMYGKNYIINYFKNKNISDNLVKHELGKYSNDIFMLHKDIITKILLNKNKSEEYIKGYLLRKGYEDE